MTIQLEAIVLLNGRSLDPWTGALDKLWMPKPEASLRTFNIRDAKNHLSRLVDEAAKGEPFIIAKAGRPMVKVVGIKRPASQKRRFGFLAGQIKVPDDFDRMAEHRIAALFGAACSRTQR